MLYFFAFLLLQTIVNVFMYFYFKQKMATVLQADELKNELENLIITFNQYADRNISLVEDKIVQANNNMQKLQEHIAKQSKQAFFHNPAASTTETKIAIPSTSNANAKANSKNFQSNPSKQSNDNAYKQDDTQALPSNNTSNNKVLSTSADLPTNHHKPIYANRHNVYSQIADVKDSNMKNNKIVDEVVIVPKMSEDNDNRRRSNNQHYQTHRENVVRTFKPSNTTKPNNRHHQKTLEDYLQEKEEYELANMTLAEKLFYYDSKGYGTTKIADILSLSNEEVNLMLLAKKAS